MVEVGRGKPLTTGVGEANAMRECGEIFSAGGAKKRRQCPQEEAENGVTMQYTVWASSIQYHESYAALHQSHTVLATICALLFARSVLEPRARQYGQSLAQCLLTNSISGCCGAC